MTPDTRHKLICVVVAGVPALLTLLAWGRLDTAAAEARREAGLLADVRQTAAEVRTLRDAQDPAAARRGPGAAADVERIAEAAGVDPSRLARIERDGGGAGARTDGRRPPLRVDLRGVGMRELTHFLERWADSAPGRGARNVNLIPEGEDQEERWTAQLRLED